MNFIEVGWRGRVHKVYFLVPDLCIFRNAQSQREAVDDIGRESHETKLIEFTKVSAALYKEMNHSRNLFNRYLSYVFNLLWLHRVEKATFFLALVLNGLFNWVLQVDVNGRVTIDLTDTILEEFFEGPCSFKWILGVLCYLLLLICVIRAVSKWVLMVPVIRFKTGSWLKTFFNVQLQLPVLYVLMTILGCYNFTEQQLAPCRLDPDDREQYIVHIEQHGTLTTILPVSYAWFSVLFLDMAHHSRTVRQVIFAVASVRSQLAYTFVFLIFMMAMFAFFMFELFHDIVQIHPKHGYCRNLWVCMWSSIAKGPRLSGGVGDILNAYDPYYGPGKFKWETLLMFSSVVYLFINLIGLNLLLGLIIDAFAKVRGINDAKLWDNENLCFICGINRRKFELSEGTNFKAHTTKHHNITAYIDFFVHIKEKPRNFLTGIESHVLQCIESKSIAWFPLEYAGDLDGKITDIDTHS